MKKVSEQRYVAFHFDVIDHSILTELKAKEDMGTIRLAKLLEVSPKNLIHRLKSHKEKGWISEDKKKANPKGWIRIWRVTERGEDMLKMYEKMNKEQQLEKDLKKEFFKDGKSN